MAKEESGADASFVFVQLEEIRRRQRPPIAEQALELRIGQNVVLTESIALGSKLEERRLEWPQDLFRQEPRSFDQKFPGQPNATMAVMVLKAHKAGEGAITVTRGFPGFTRDELKIRVS